MGFLDDPGAGKSRTTFRKDPSRRIEDFEITIPLRFYIHCDPTNDSVMHELYNLAIKLS